MATVHDGGCFCGAVRIRVSGEPDAMVYCHCTSCRSWSGSPVHAVKPVEQVVTQRPESQVWPGAHARPHDPQLAGSRWMLAQ